MRYFKAVTALATVIATLVSGLNIPIDSTSASDLKIDPSKFKFYNLDRPNAGPCDLVPGPDGAIYIQNDLSATISRFDPKTEKITTYDIPYTNPPQDPSTLPNVAGLTPLACAIQPGKDGKIYASAGTRNQFVVMDINTKKIEVFNPRPRNTLGNLQTFNDLYRADEGMFYTQTTGNAVSFFDYNHRKQKVYQIPTPASLPLGLYVAKDKSIWFTEFGASKMGRLNATTGEFKEYPCPLELLQPGVIRAAYGPYLYFTATVGNAIGRIDIRNGNMKAFPSPEALTTPTVDIGDKYGNVWYSSITQNLLGRLVRKTGKVQVIHTPFLSAGAPSLPITDLSVTYHHGTNSIYFTSTFNNKLGRLQLPI